MTDNQKENLVTNIVNDWFLMHKIKGIRDVRITYNNGKIFLYQEDNESIYNIDNKEMLGHINDVSEDLRDYLRRRGIKIYADRFFKSIESNWINK